MTWSAALKQAWFENNPKSKYGMGLPESDFDIFRKGLKKLNLLAQ